MSCAADSSTSCGERRAALACQYSSSTGRSQPRKAGFGTDHASRRVKDGHVLQDRRAVVRDDDLALGRLDLETEPRAGEKGRRAGQQRTQEARSSRACRTVHTHHLVHALGAKRGPDSVTDGLGRVHVREADLHGLALRAEGEGEVSSGRSAAQRSRAALVKGEGQERRTLSLNCVLPTLDTPIPDMFVQTAAGEGWGVRERGERERGR